MNFNQKCLIVISVVILFPICVVGISVVSTGVYYQDLIGLIPFAIIGLIPALVVFLQIRKKRKSRKRKRLYRFSQTPPSDRYLALSVYSGEILPELCCTCGSQTKRTTLLKFNESRDSSPSKYSFSNVNPVILIFILVKFTSIAIFASIYVFFERLFNKGLSKRGNLKFKIPQCRSCSKKYPILRHHLNFHGGSMIIHARDTLVHEVQKRRGIEFLEREESSS